MPQVKAGNGIPFHLQLESLATDRFVRAYAFTEDGAALAGSPFTMTHVANGLYIITSGLPSMPEKMVIATYLVYTDALFRLLDDENLPSVDSFWHEETEVRLIPDLTAEVAQNENVTAEIEQSGTITGEVFDDEAITGETLSDMIEGQVLDNEIIEGESHE